MTAETVEMPVEHDHEWERGAHMAEAFGVDGRRLACAVCGEYRSIPIDTRDRCVQCGALVDGTPAPITAPRTRGPAAIVTTPTSDRRTT